MKNWTRASVRAITIIVAATSALALAPLAVGMTPQQVAALMAASTSGYNTPAQIYNAQDVGDPRSRGAVCNGSTNIATQVDALVTSGYKTIVIPANCLYIPDSNTTPAGVTLVGENWITSIVSTSNRATSQVNLGAGSVLKNVGIISLFCDSLYSQQKICPTPYMINNSSSVIEAEGWPFETFLSSGSAIPPGGTLPVTDAPNIACIANGAASDCIYAQSNASGASAMRVITGASGGGDNGIYILNGYTDATTTDSHYAIFAKELGQGSDPTFYIDRATAGSVAPSLTITDVDSTGNNTSPLITLTAAHQTSGQFINIFQAVSAYSGNVMQANMGASGGSFAGNFILFQANGSNVFSVDASGDVSGAALTATGFSALEGSGFLGNASSNYLGWSGAGSGGGTPYISANGADTNVNLKLLPKGAGTVQITAVSSFGSAPTITTGSCSGSSWIGGASIGQFTAALCAAGTYIISGLPSSPHGYICNAQDQTTPADTLKQTANSTASCTLTSTTAAGDVVVVSALGY